MVLCCSKKLSILLRGTTSKHDGDFYYLNRLLSFRTENKFKSHEKMCKNKDLWGIVMPSEKNNILKFNQYMKFDKMPYVIYADLESLTKKNSRYMIKQSKKISNNENRWAHPLWIWAVW